MKATLCTFAFVVLFGLVIVGCGSSTSQSNGPFPTGKFKAVGPGELGEFIIDLKADGNYTLARMDKQSGGGLFKVNGNQVSFQSSLCAVPGQETGTYTWSFDGTRLLLNSTDDKCGDRWRILTLVWMKQ